MAEYNNGALPSAPTNEYIYAGGQRIMSVQSGVTNYWHCDHLSPRVRTDSSGNVADQRGAFPYGETWYSPGQSSYMFTTYYRDYESGNDYAQARFDITRLGRFSSPDPISGSTSDPQSLNRYSYVLNDPANLADPLGLDPCDTDTASGGCVSVSADPTDGGDSSDTDFGGLGGLFGLGVDVGPLPLLYLGGRKGAGGITSAGQINQLRNALITALLSDPDCLSLLGGRGAGSGPLSVVENTPIDIQHVADDSGVHAVTSVDRSPASTVPTGAQIHINDSGLFFVRGLQVSFGGQFTLNTGTPSFQAAVLLHEFGHATGTLGPDINAGVNQQNNAAVADHCKKTIQGFSNK